MSVEEYKGFYAVFYLKARSKVRRQHADPVARYYRWWLALYNTTPSRIEEIARNWRPLGKRSKLFKDIIMDGEVDLVLPAYDPVYYVEFAEERLGCRVRYYERRVAVGDEKHVVKVPIIEFPSDVAEHVFATYSSSLVTFANPSLKAQQVMKGTMRLFKWADWLGIATLALFKEVRTPQYASNGYKEVTRIGKAFTVLAGIRR